MNFASKIICLPTVARRFFGSAPTFTVALSSIVLGLSACTSEPKCDYSKAPYMSAQSIPELKAPEGLSAPDHSGALVVPPVPPNWTPPAKGKGKCLDRPPSYFSTTPPKTGETAPEKK